MFVTKAWLATMTVAVGIGIAGCNAPEASADPGIVTDSTGELRDCTVTDRYGYRADFDQSCDEFWSHHKVFDPDADGDWAYNIRYDVYQV